jgi:hypothetical protein
MVFSLWHSAYGNLNGNHQVGLCGVLQFIRSDVVQTEHTSTPLVSVAFFVSMHVQLGLICLVGKIHNERHFTTMYRKVDMKICAGCC